MSSTKRTPLGQLPVSARHGWVDISEEELHRRKLSDINTPHMRMDDGRISAPPGETSGEENLVKAKRGKGGKVAVGGSAKREDDIDEHDDGNKENINPGKAGGT
jgi:hypothetical protein